MKDNRASEVSLTAAQRKVKRGLSGMKNSFEDDTHGCGSSKETNVKCVFKHAVQSIHKAAVGERLLSVDPCQGSFSTGGIIIGGGGLSKARRANPIREGIQGGEERNWPPYFNMPLAQDNAPL